MADRLPALNFFDLAQKCRIKKNLDIMEADLRDVLLAVKIKESDNQPCVSDARVMCTCAKTGAQAVHIKKNGKLVEISDLSELTKQDILLEKQFDSCSVLTDKKCSVTIADIEDGEWQDVDETQNQGKDQETLKFQTSYMICTKGYGIIYFVSAGQELKDYVDEIVDFMSILQEQFGFDVKAAGIMCQIYTNIQEKYTDLSDKEKAWYFARTISQMGGYNNKPVTFLFLEYETNAWKKGAGIVYKYDEEKKFVCEELGIAEEDYAYVRYMVRLQHFMTSDAKEYSYSALLKLKKDKKDDFETWKENMEKALGKELSDEAYLNNYEEIYNRVSDTGDYSHMMYTIAANLIDSKKGVDNSWNNMGAPDLSWESKEERKDITGWLGDAVYTGDENEVSFGNDDFIADLDADNISYRILKDSNMLTSMCQYYQGLPQGDEDTYRITEFLENNSYENIEKAIFERIKVSDINGDQKLTMEDLKGNEVYEDTYLFLEKLKEVEGKK